MSAEQTTLARRSNTIATLALIIAFVGMITTLPHWTTKENAAKEKGARIAANEIWKGNWNGDDGSLLQLDLRSDKIAITSFSNTEGFEYKVIRVQENGKQLIITVSFEGTETTMEYYLQRPTDGKISGHWINNSKRFKVREGDIFFTKALKIK